MMKAETREIGGETGLFGRDPKVSRQREAESASNGCALDRRDDRQWLLE
jgi:hypothetical protein